MKDIVIPRVVTTGKVDRIIRFPALFDCEEAAVFADLYVLGETTKTATIGQTYGVAKGQELLINLQFDDIPEGQYVLKVFDPSKGVLAKTWVSVYE